MGFADGLLLGIKMMTAICFLYIINEVFMNPPRPLYSAEIFKFEHGKLTPLGAVALPRRYSTSAGVVDLGHSSYLLFEPGERADEHRVASILTLSKVAPTNIQATEKNPAQNLEQP